MEPNSPAHMARRILIGRIETLSIGQPGAALSFEGRLAAENGWTGSFADRVATEYRRFLALVAISDEQLTPSDAVDQAWHLHLAYTRDYWHGLCRDIVARDIHHEPTSGGPEQREHYRDRYAHTLNLYRDTFGAAPPDDVWPDPSERFSGNFQRIDRTRKVLLGAEETTLVGFTCAGLVVLIVQDMAALVAVFLLAVAIVTWIQGARLKAGTAGRRFDLNFDGDACGSDGCGSGDGGCGGGCGGGCS